MVADTGAGEPESFVAKGEGRGRSAEGVRRFDCNRRGYLVKHCRSKSSKEGKGSSCPSPSTDRDLDTSACVADSQRSWCSTREPFNANFHDVYTA